MWKINEMGINLESSDFNVKYGDKSQNIMLFYMLIALITEEYLIQ
tara:strand:- start:4 stop:138 length:135 start_codon:yes stop_codon:yes gene_type:complete